MTAVHAGGCRCGAVRFTAKAGPHFTSYCHCADCRHATGAPVAAFAGFHDVEISWSADAFASYGEAPVSRFFCPSCGAPVGYRDARLPGCIYFYTGAMDRPELYPPTQHAFAGEQLPWLPLHDDLPHNDATTVKRPEKAG